MEKHIFGGLEMAQIKLVASDIDGTLLNSDKKSHTGQLKQSKNSNKWVCMWFYVQAVLLVG